MLSVAISMENHERERREEGRKEGRGNGEEDEEDEDEEREEERRRRKASCSCPGTSPPFFSPHPTVHFSLNFAIGSIQLLVSRVRWSKGGGRREEEDRSDCIISTFTGSYGNDKYNKFAII